MKLLDQTLFYIKDSFEEELSYNSEDKNIEQYLQQSIVMMVE